MMLNVTAISIADFEEHQIRKPRGDNACWQYIGRDALVTVRLPDQTLHQLTPQQVIFAAYHNWIPDDSAAITPGCGNPLCCQPLHLHTGSKRRDLPPFLTVRETATLMQTNSYAVMRAIRAGVLPGIRLSKREGYRIPRAALYRVGVA